MIPRPFKYVQHFNNHYKPGANESKKNAKGGRKRESKYKKQETKRFSTFAISRLRHSETKKIKQCFFLFRSDADDKPRMC